MSFCSTSIKSGKGSSVALLFLLISFAAAAQTGCIKGTIQTQDNLPGSFVNVTLKEVPGKGTLTDEKGNFSLNDLAPATYTVIIMRVGAEMQQKNAIVLAGKTTVLNFQLSETVNQLNEVEITETKTINERPVAVGKIAIKPMDLPQSVAIINHEVLEQQQTLRLSEAVQNINGVYQMGNTGGTQEELAARGFALGSSNTFKNGVRFNNSIMPEVSALEKVEVLKGSNAILYGNVSAGGALNLVTKKPKFANGGEITFRTGSYSFYKPSLDLYGTVNNSSKVAYRLNTSYENAGSFRDQVSSERFYVNPSLLFKLTNKTELLLEGDYLHDNRMPDYGVGSINYKLANVPRDRFLGVNWGYANAEQKTATATITHRFNKTWQLQGVLGHQHYSNDQYSAARPNAASQMVKEDGTWVRTLARAKTEEAYNIAQLDLTGAFNTGFLKHTLLFGGDAEQYRTETPTFKIIYDPKNAKVTTYDTINILNPVTTNQSHYIPEAQTITLTKSPTNRAGVYVQDLLGITNQLKVLAGVRYTYQETASNVTDLVKAKTTETKNYDAAFTPRFGVVYQPLETTALFASYANSFALNTGLDINGKALAPSFVDQYEIGIKNDLFHGLFSANVTAYHIVNSNMAQMSLENGNTNTNIKELAGEVTSKGVEVDLVSKNYNGFSMLGGYSYNDTRYTKSNTYIVGSKLRYNPAHTANVSLYYTFKETSFLNGFNTGITSFFAGDRVAGRSSRVTVQNDSYKLMTLPDYTLFDAHVGYTFQKLAVRVKVTNLLNKLSYNVHDDNSVNPIAPRMFSATVTYKL